MDTWSRPIWDLHMLFLLRPILPTRWLCFFLNLHFEPPWVLSRFYGLHKNNLEFIGYQLGFSASIVI